MLVGLVRDGPAQHGFVSNVSSIVVSSPPVKYAPASVFQVFQVSVTNLK